MPKVFYDKQIFAKNLVRLMKEHQEKQTDIAALLKVSKSTVSDYCKGAQMPRMDKIEMLALHYGVQKSELLDDAAASSTPAAEPMPRILQIHESLNESGQAELERYGVYLTEQDIYRRKDSEPHIDYIRHYIVPAAAGYASPIEGEDYEIIPLPPNAPRAADFCITISGDSMEPYIHDGDLAYVKRGVNLQPFDVGVFYVDGDVLCKQYCVDAFQNLYLLSANPRREDANRVLRAGSNSTVICYGRVLLPHPLPRPSYY